MRSKEEREWEATKTRVQNASSRETMALIVRDGDLVGMAEAIGVVEGDDDANRNRREIVSTRVSSIAGTRTAVDAARAFFVDSSAEAGPCPREKNARNGKGKEDDDGRLEEPFLWAPGEAERAAARKMALEDARHAAAVARDEARREMLSAQRESLASGALRRSGEKKTSATETERARASVDRERTCAAPRIHRVKATRRGRPPRPLLSETRRTTRQRRCGTRRTTIEQPGRPGRRFIVGGRARRGVRFHSNSFSVITPTLSCSQSSVAYADALADLASESSFWMFMGTGS